MPITPIQLLLADDDHDDCLLFSEALQELSIDTCLNLVHDGVELFDFLSDTDSKTLPDLIFLDLNMPRKNGQECLAEIKQNDKYGAIPIAIFSTSYDPIVAARLREMGADYYIRKPADFSVLKKVLLEVLSIIQNEESMKAYKDKFILLS